MTEPEVIYRSEGSTPSEKYLAKLCDQSFLKLWSYTNVYVDRRKGGKGDGKELCDLLVVCGDYVLIFSDKTIGWQGDENIELSWRRWFNRAIHHSARQIRKAERWIEQLADKIYLDKACTKPFPYTLPPPARRKVLGIIVALGASSACKKYFGESTGSLMLLPEIKGLSHLKDGSAPPFAVGDIDPDGPFIHVLDDVTLDIVLSELDTVTDFASYLERKAAFFRSGKLLSAGGEEDLLSYYLTHMNKANEHDFTRPDGMPLRENDHISIETGNYIQFRRNPQYLEKKRADEYSYIWDQLIEMFTDHMRAGTTIVPNGEPFVLSDYEKAVRYMALVNRFNRRLYGKAIHEAINIGRDAPRFTRSFLPGDHAADRETAFFFMTLARPNFELENGYEQYRAVRRRKLETYALGLLHEYKTLRRVVGIGTEPSGTGSSSEDLIFVDDIEWTDDLVKSVEERKEIYGIMQPERMIKRPVREDEYPAVSGGFRGPMSQGAEPPQMNRRQRRAMKARERKNKTVT